MFSDCCEVRSEHIAKLAVGVEGKRDKGSSHSVTCDLVLVQLLTLGIVQIS
jgi:hypothetical protein